MLSDGAGIEVSTDMLAADNPLGKSIHVHTVD